MGKVCVFINSFPNDMIRTDDLTVHGGGGTGKCSMEMLGINLVSYFVQISKNEPLHTYSVPGIYSP